MTVKGTLRLIHFQKDMMLQKLILIGWWLFFGGGCVRVNGKGGLTLSDSSPRRGLVCGDNPDLCCVVSAAQGAVLLPLVDDVLLRPHVDQSTFIYFVIATSLHNQTYQYWVHCAVCTHRWQLSCPFALSYNVCSFCTLCSLHC